MTIPILTGYRRDPEGTHPPLNSPDYLSTALRHPKQPLVLLPQQLTELTGPVLGEGRIGSTDHDLTAQHRGTPQGQRIIVHGRLLDGDGRPIPNALIEIWQANAGGRYRHDRDRWDCPLDPNFDGAGRTLTDSLGRYEFITIKPGAYPWRNHHNAWRPAHIHLSVFGQQVLADLGENSARQPSVEQTNNHGRVRQPGRRRCTRRPLRAVARTRARGHQGVQRLDPAADTVRCRPRDRPHAS